MDVTLVVILLTVANMIIWVCILAMFLKMNSAKKYVQINEQKTELNLDLIFNAQTSLAEGMQIIIKEQEKQDAKFKELQDRLDTIILILKEGIKTTNNGHKPEQAVAAVTAAVPSNRYEDLLFAEIEAPAKAPEVVKEQEPEPEPEQEIQVNIVQNPAKKERSPEERKAFGEKMKAAREAAKAKKENSEVNNGK